MAIEKSCGALIFRQEGGRRLYLLLHYAGGHWDFPKGHVEKGESEEQTALREIKEETGLASLEFIPDFREEISYSFRHNTGETAEKQVAFFLAKTGEKLVRLSDEHIGFAWLSYPSALKKATYENARMLLEKAEKRLSEAPA
ncbi:MAG: bis(5'-nucleosyl)-tetraphosphatase [Candidatus Micrarchaeota archaeon]|nr:bis(5'-nucleosyl)-tetraphosphatase [Candidatus Micrarchaeota archaeon]